MRPTSAVRICSAVPPSIDSCMSASTSAGACVPARSASVRAKARKSSFLATKSVSLLTSTSAPSFASSAIHSATTPSAATRVAALLALLPSFTRRISSARARSPAASASAFLHSIIGASVFSRSSLTMLAVIAVIAPLLALLPASAWPCPAARAPALIFRSLFAHSSPSSSTNSSSSAALLAISCSAAARPSRMASAAPRAYRRIALPESSLPGMT